MTDKNSAKQTLLITAAMLFRAKGYERTTVRDLAKAVGLQSGSLFYHFKNKEEILVEIMRSGIQAVTEAVSASISNEDNITEQLVAMATAHLQMLLGPSQDALAVMLYEWRSLPEEGLNEILQLRNEYEQLWTAKIGLAAEQGLVSGNTGTRRRFVLGALNWSSNWFNAGGELNVDDLAREAIDMLFD